MKNNIFKYVAFTLLFALLALAPHDTDAQKLSERQESIAADNTLFAVQDSTNAFTWRKVSLKRLKEIFLPFRTPYGNLPTVDSSVQFNGDVHLQNNYLNSTDFNGYKENGRGINVFMLNSKKSGTSPLLGIYSTYAFPNGSEFQSANFLMSQIRQFHNITRTATDTIYLRNGGSVQFDHIMNYADGYKGGRSISNWSATSNSKTSELVWATSFSNKNPSLFLLHDNSSVYTNFSSLKTNASIWFHRDFTDFRKEVRVQSTVTIKDAMTLQSRTTLPSSPAEGTMVLHYTGSRNILKIFANGTWVGITP